MPALDDRTVRLAVQLLERTAGHRRRCRRCRGVIRRERGKRGSAWSLCAGCTSDIERDARQAEIEPVGRCLVCRDPLDDRRPRCPHMRRRVPERAIAHPEQTLMKAMMMTKYRWGADG